MYELLESKIHRILEYNFTKTHTFEISFNYIECEIYKTGTYLIDEIEEINQFIDSKLVTRDFDVGFLNLCILFKRLRNFLLVEYEKSEVLDAIVKNLDQNTFLSIKKDELFLYFISCEQFSDAFKIINYNIEFTGCDAYTSTDVKHTIDVMQFLTNEQTRTKKVYKHKNYKEVCFAIYEFLENTELLFLYGKYKEISITEENDVLRENHLKSICSFLLNYKEINLLSFFIEHANEFEEGFYDVNKKEYCENSLFHVVKSDFIFTISLVLMKQFEYKECYDRFLQFYLFRNERIKCLIGMRNNEILEKELLDFMFKIFRNEGIEKTEQTFEFLNSINLEIFSEKNKKQLSGIFIKLGHLYQDYRFYDISYRIYPDFKPLKAKSMFFFTKKDFVASLKVCEELRKMNSEMVDVNFNYGCCLIELEKYTEAIKVFKKLKFEDPLNITIATNLSHCYGKLNDVEQALLSLKQIAKTDQRIMKKYFILSIKNTKIEEIKFALANIKIDKLVEEGINFLIYNKLLFKDEILEILKNNKYYDQEETYNF
ncbi:Ttc27 [Ecytonucleospora hepatopenaei]|uniref:Ttc27 n=1 Tax=Ecytonucleospora hepatopenaei TaxID=646526 RepID=A0A1W0E876_9MICR|nr:hypothetical protein EHP00_2562 [Ecytonucleospora hepatopenaei]OQS55586.1 Ttc27 [Ecytonucleospora hepatopenaei]